MDAAGETQPIAAAVPDAGTVARLGEAAERGTVDRAGAAPDGGMVDQAGAAPHGGVADRSGGGPAEEEPDTQQRIFDAALEVFARKGRDGARLQEIADHGGINRALLYYYYRTKEQLYEAVLAHGCRQFMTGLSQQLEAEEGLEDSLRTFVYGYIDHIHGHQDMARLMLNECICGGGALERHLTEALAAREGVPGLMLEDRLRAAAEAGEIRAVDLRHTLLTIVSACLFPFVALPTVRLFHSRAVQDPGRFMDERKSHIVDLLLGGLRPRSGARGSGSSVRPPESRSDREAAR